MISVKQPGEFSQSEHIQVTASRSVNKNTASPQKPPVLPPIITPHREPYPDL